MSTAVDVGSGAHELVSAAYKFKSRLGWSRTTDGRQRRISPLRGPGLAMPGEEALEPQPLRPST